MAWLERERPDVYAAILRADRASRATRGHGNAIAQAYGHAILPLCSRRDKATQVRWGLADFRHRFGREAAGMWLPETAVDRETLEVLADEGVQFTLLAPGQAGSVREPGGVWRPGTAALDSRRAYRCQAGHGRELALFFYDGPISHAIAFDGLLRSGDAMATRLLAGFEEGSRPQLIHVATDGESYGHHHRFGEMALAAACAGSGERRRHPHQPRRLFGGPSPDAGGAGCRRLVVELRARRGALARRLRVPGGRHPGWTQRWRAPLREALDWLRDAVDPLYEARAATLLKDPWAARDAYVQVILDKSPPSVEAFFDRPPTASARCGRPCAGAPLPRAPAAPPAHVHVLRLVLRRDLGDRDGPGASIRRTRAAARAGHRGRHRLSRPNSSGAWRLPRRTSPELRDGAGVWRRHVVPAVTDLARVAAHYAIAGPSEGMAIGPTSTRSGSSGSRGRVRRWARHRSRSDACA